MPCARMWGLSGETAESDLSLEFLAAGGEWMSWGQGGAWEAVTTERKRCLDQAGGGGLEEVDI